MCQMYGLGNPPHRDFKDGHQCYAQWYVQGNGNQVRSWWFLLPQHGLAIELCDGACISWDGRDITHCTAASLTLGEDCKLYSLWCSVHQTLIDQVGLDASVRDALRRRQRDADSARFATGDDCYLLWRSGRQMAVQAIRVSVRRVCVDGSVVVRELAARRDYNPPLTRLEAQRYLVPVAECI